MLAGSRTPYDAVNEQHSRRCGVTTAGRPRLWWAAVAQGGVALRIHIRGRSRPLVLFGATVLLIVFIVRLARNASICPLARDGRTMPSASNSRSCGVTTAGRRCHRGQRSLKGESPFECISEGEPRSRLVWRKDTSSIVLVVRLAHNAAICSLAHDGRTMPSASSTFTFVESQRRGDRGPPWAAVVSGSTPSTGDANGIIISY